eukprot:jgi/Mesen1/9608/ME000659S08984
MASFGGKSLDKLKVGELKEELKKLGLPLGGLKKDLQDRLREATASASGNPTSPPGTAVPSPVGHGSPRSQRLRGTPLPVPSGMHVTAHEEVGHKLASGVDAAPSPAAQAAVQPPTSDSPAAQPQPAVPEPGPASEPQPAVEAAIDLVSEPSSEPHPAAEPVSVESAPALPENPVLVADNVSVEPRAEISLVEETASDEPANNVLQEESVVAQEGSEGPGLNANSVGVAGEDLSTPDAVVAGADAVAGDSATKPSLAGETGTGTGTGAPEAVADGKEAQAEAEAEAEKDALQTDTAVPDVEKEAVAPQEQGGAGVEEGEEGKKVEAGGEEGKQEKEDESMGEGGEQGEAVKTAPGKEPESETEGAVAADAEVAGAGEALDSGKELLSLLEDEEPAEMEELEGEGVGVGVGSQKGREEKEAMEIDGEAADASKKRKFDRPPVDVAKRQRRWGANGEQAPPREGISPRAREVLSPRGTLPGGGIRDPPGASALRPGLRREPSDAAANGAPRERVVPPSKEPETRALRIDNFARPFTQRQVQDLLARTGSVQHYWMDSIRTHCFVAAAATRHALYNLKWPERDGKLLLPQFVDPQEVLAKTAAAATPGAKPGAGTAGGEAAAAKSGEAGKTAAAATPGSGGAIARSGSEKEAAAGREEVAASVGTAASAKRPPPPDSEPSVTLDDLFRKTKAKPPIYFLPLSEEQIKLKKKGVKNNGAAPLKARA